MTRHVVFGGGLLLLAAVVAMPNLTQAQDSAASAAAAKGAIQHDKVVAGSQKDFMEVRHVVLKGTNEEIGRALATLARERYDCKAIPSTDRLRTRAQRR